MTNEENMRVAVNMKVEQHWDKMVKDSKQIAGSNYHLYGQDLLMFTISDFLTKKDIAYQYKVAVTDDKLLNYLGRAMALNIKSNTSPFWTNYRKYLYNTRGIYEIEYEGTNGDPINYEVTTIDEDFDLEPKYKSATDCMQWAVEQLDFYYGALVDQYYYQKKTFVEIAEYYNIPKYAVIKDIKEAKKILKQHCKHIEL